ncbi:hypothetical protein LP417_26230 [Polaromonas sp. P1-6]|nr:hypothetical protein LP417_26230 [Polaromonas sp. P1-6]
MSALSHDCALALLTHSIAMGHDRLAVIRLVMAVDADARVQLEHWTYCTRMAKTSGDARLQEMYRSAVIKFTHGPLLSRQSDAREVAVRTPE